MGHEQGLRRECRIWGWRRRAFACAWPRLKTWAAGLSRRSPARPVTRFGFEDQFRQVVHPLRIQDPIKMIGLVLYDPGVEASRCPRDFASIEVEAAIPDVFRSLDEPPQSRHRKTSFPTPLRLGIQHFNLGVDQYRKWGSVIVLLAFRYRPVGSILRRLEHQYAKGYVDLGGRQPRAVRIDHGFDHARHQRAYFRRGRVGDRFGAAGEYWMAHSGNFQDGHVSEYGVRSAPGQKAGAG